MKRAKKFLAMTLAAAMTLSIMAPTVAAAGPASLASMAKRTSPYWLDQVKDVVAGPAEDAPVNKEALAKWADNLYEPETKVALPATIVWPATLDAENVAHQAVRPNSMIVTVDKDLNVLTLEGRRISSDLGAYLVNTKDTALTIFYLRDQASTNALDMFIQNNGVEDVMVMANVENGNLVDQICDHNAGVNGAIDFTDAKLTSSREDLYSITANTNKNHSKIAVIPQSLATYENLDYLHTMIISVWVQTGADDASIYSALTSGANGVVCSDYKAVNDALESFNDVTTSLRHVVITGHRGMPGAGYVENTIRSERAAIEAGANAIENDIQLSSDNQIFILHDDDAKRMFNRPDITDIEALTLAELQAMRFDATDDTKEKAPNSILNSNNTNRTTARRANYVLNYDESVDFIPNLREYWQSLGDKDVVQFTEIKTEKVEIVAPLRALAEEMGMEDRVIVITFHDGFSNNGYKSYSRENDVLAEMQEVWPECSVGYLGMDGYSSPNLNKIIAANGGKTGEAVGTLMTQLQPYNSTYHNYNTIQSMEVIHDGRHRGLLCNPWTYNTEEVFAKHYLAGIYSLTTNFACWASDYPVQIKANNMSIDQNGAKLNCTVIAQDGDVIANPQGLSLVTISGPNVSLNSNTGVVTADGSGQALVMVRMDLDLNVNNFDLAGAGVDTHYAIYSNPFYVNIK